SASMSPSRTPPTSADRSASWNPRPNPLKRCWRETMVKAPDQILQPGGYPIGSPGSDPGIRELPGGRQAANDLFNELTPGGKDITAPEYRGRLVEVPGGGTVGLRPASKSGPPTIDVNIPGISVRKVKFK